MLGEEEKVVSVRATLWPDGAGGRGERFRGGRGQTRRGPGSSLGPRMDGAHFHRMDAFPVRQLLDKRQKCFCVTTNALRRTLGNPFSALRLENYKRREKEI